MNIESRVNYYLGDFINNPEHDENDNNIIGSDCLEINNNKFPYTHYDKELYNLLKTTENLDKKFSFHRGDNHPGAWPSQYLDTKPYCLVKNRFESDKGVILRCMNLNRHWSLQYNRSLDIPFELKKNAVVWRGTTTGREDYSANRFTLVTKWGNKYSDVDVGFSFLHRDSYIQKYKKYVKGPRRISNLVKYKQMLSGRGNDKDSG